jgi:hypothetical protein
MDQSPDLTDQATLDALLTEAVEFDKLQKRGKEVDGLIFLPNQLSAFTGWSKETHSNGQVSDLIQ